jgi:hypothetical protein
VLADQDELDPRLTTAIAAAVADTIKTDREESEKARKHDLRLARYAWFPVIITAAIGVYTAIKQDQLGNKTVDLTHLEATVKGKLDENALAQEGKLKTRDQDITDKIAAGARVSNEAIAAGNRQTTLDVAQLEWTTQALAKQIERVNNVDVNDTAKAKLYIDNNSQLKTKDGDQAVIALWFLAGNNKESSPRQKETIATAALLAAQSYPDVSTAKRGLDALGLDARKIVLNIQRNSPSLSAQHAAREYLNGLNKEEIEAETNVDNLALGLDIADGQEPVLHNLLESAIRDKRSGRDAVAKFATYWSKKPRVEVPLRLVLALAGYEGQVEKVAAIALADGEYSNMASNYLQMSDIEYDPKFFKPLLSYSRQILEHYPELRTRHRSYMAGNRIFWFLTLFSNNPVLHTDSIIDLKHHFTSDDARQVIPWNQIDEVDRGYIVTQLDRSEQTGHFSAQFAVTAARRTGDFRAGWYYVATRLADTPYDREKFTEDEDLRELIRFFDPPNPRNNWISTDDYNKLSAISVPKIDSGTKAWSDWKACYESKARNNLKILIGDSKL